jgi:hypothetical protein
VNRAEALDEERASAQSEIFTAPRECRYINPGQRLLRVFVVTNERENDKECLGRNRRSEQTQMLENLKFVLTHVVTSEERGVVDESLPGTAMASAVLLASGIGGRSFRDGQGARPAVG